MSEPNRAEWEKRVARAKAFADLILNASRSNPRFALIPDEVKAALAELSILLVELARLSHAKFDVAPFPDYAELVRRVESLESFKTITIRNQNDVNVNRQG